MSAAAASFQGPNRIVVVPVLKAVELYRIVNVERPHHPGLVLDLTSNYERQARPRRVERFCSIRLRLPGGAGFCVDAPPKGAHRSLWGAPVHLAAWAVDDAPA
ncbi:MAG TPA: hypothetical protein VKB25_16000 [Conexibacter sp.]|nr:hypothetical protein [Conexibacter sp.]